MRARVASIVKIDNRVEDVGVAATEVCDSIGVHARRASSGQLPASISIRLRMRMDAEKSQGCR
jgi:hypothetical protein